MIMNRLAGDNEPDNAGVTIAWDEATGSLQLSYEDKLLFDGHVVGATSIRSSMSGSHAVTQCIQFAGKQICLEGRVFAGHEAIAAETRGDAQKKFPLIRTTNGAPSRNLRNNAVYDRGRDWLLSGATCIEPLREMQFRFAAVGDAIQLTFQPRFYQHHKGIAHFHPWTYTVRQDSITGWSSWWAYMRNFSAGNLDQLLAVWKDKHFADYGYRFIQIDDCFQGGEHDRHRLLANRGYPGGHPETWLCWRSDLFPAGLDGYVASVTSAGFEPAIWIGAHFGDMDVADQHPDWFVRDPDGKPSVGSWSGYAIDALNQVAVEKLIRPTYRGLKAAGVSYVKIDILRHYLYDNLHQQLAYCRAHHCSPADILRGYLEVARQEVGPETFILSCWGVLPETAGLVDACRIGSDGYGPVTMQQYNSWNGIVWRNDPDHCDVYPKFKPAEVGNVVNTTTVAAAPEDTIIRPALASIAGCVLILSDQPAVYQNDANLEGLRRAAPVLFSVPGQLYDFDESKSQNLLRMQRTDITSGAKPAPVDADQHGLVCPWWLNEFNRPFEHWNVLHHLNWSDSPTGTTTLLFADIGVDPCKAQLVFEFWSRHFLGSFTGSVELPANKAKGLHSFAIREQLDHPQIISTSRHISQGGVDLLTVAWESPVLHGRSCVVCADPYELTLHVPDRYVFQSVTTDDLLATSTIQDGELLRVSILPTKTGELVWRCCFISR